MVLMGDGGMGLAALAWLVAASLAVALGGVTFGIAACRRRRQLEVRLRALERAVQDFCDALRARAAIERDRGFAEVLSPRAEQAEVERVA